MWHSGSHQFSLDYVIFPFKAPCSTMPTATILLVFVWSPYYTFLDWKRGILYSKYNTCTALPDTSVLLTGCARDLEGFKCLDKRRCCAVSQHTSTSLHLWVRKKWTRPKSTEWAPRGFKERQKTVCAGLKAWERGYHWYGIASVLGPFYGKHFYGMGSPTYDITQW